MMTTWRDGNGNWVSTVREYPMCPCVLKEAKPDEATGQLVVKPIITKRSTDKNTSVCPTCGRVWFKEAA